MATSSDMLVDMLEFRRKPKWTKGMPKGACRPFEDRFEDITMPEPNSGCILFLGYLNEKGYGSLYFNGRVMPAHRAAYRAFVSEIPKGLQIDHTCRNTACVNVTHLEPVTNLENRRRAAAYRRSQPKPPCPMGHASALQGPRGIGMNCLECHREKGRQYMADKRAKERACKPDGWIEASRQQAALKRVGKNTPRPEITALEVRNLRGQGISISSIARHFGCARVTIRRRLTEKHHG